MNLNDAIGLLRQLQDASYTLWTFYFTATAAILGFVYGNDFARSSKTARVIATALYLGTLYGNSNAILSTQEIMLDLHSKILIDVQNRGKFPESESADFKIDISSVVRKFHVSEVNSVKYSYWSMSLLALIGIWIEGIARVDWKYSARKRDASRDL